MKRAPSRNKSPRRDRRFANDKCGDRIKRKARPIDGWIDPRRVQIELKQTRKRDRPRADGCRRVTVHYRSRKSTRSVPRSRSGRDFANAARFPKPEERKGPEIEGLIDLGGTIVSISRQTARLWGSPTNPTFRAGKLRTT